jgi:hypothetical protein
MTPLIAAVKVRSVCQTASVFVSFCYYAARRVRPTASWNSSLPVPTLSPLTMETRLFIWLQSSAFPRQTPHPPVHLPSRPQTSAIFSTYRSLTAAFEKECSTNATMVL